MSPINSTFPWLPTNCQYPIWFCVQHSSAYIKDTHGQKCSKSLTEFIQCQNCGRRATLQDIVVTLILPFCEWFDSLVLCIYPSLSPGSVDIIISFISIHWNWLTKCDIASDRNHIFFFVFFYDMTIFGCECFVDKMNNLVVLCSDWWIFRDFEYRLFIISGSLHTVSVAL